MEQHCVLNANALARLDIFQHNAHLPLTLPKRRNLILVVIEIASTWTDDHVYGNRNRFLHNLCISRAYPKPTDHSVTRCGSSIHQVVTKLSIQIPLIPYLHSSSSSSLRIHSRLHTINTHFQQHDTLLSGRVRPSKMRDPQVSGITREGSVSLNGDGTALMKRGSDLRYCAKQWSILCATT